MNLFNIDKNLIELYDKASEMTYDEQTGNYVDYETGEVINIDAEIGKLGLDRVKKLSNTALYIINLISDSERLNARAKAIKERAVAKANLAVRLKKNIAASMVLFGEKKIETDDVVLTTRQSTSVDIINENELPEKYLIIKTEKRPDKVEIGKALKAGEEINGAILKSTTSVIIK